MFKRSPIEIPPQIARQFAAHMRAYHAEQNDTQRGEIAVRTRHMLLEHMPSGSNLRLNEIRKLFDLMR
ncbi:hypothetical protein [Bradyrhizobium lablabi]|uniref:hypothetical protein n=1 Tax=Bradyrhizobium lablabi TaxID=722472 RepID=UPI001BAD85BB|nr:hypothetical protein [Bradyrhizobium lablabi]MBR0698259.1 hypothetical protein [Bradyrhizobium lablabi]